MMGFSNSIFCISSQVSKYVNENMIGQVEHGNMSLGRMVEMVGMAKI